MIKQKHSPFIRLILSLTLTLLFFPTSHAAETIYSKESLNSVIGQLEQLLKQGDLCGQQLNIKAKEAINSDECTAFTTEFSKHWPTREDLTIEIQTIKEQWEQGAFKCDDCAARVKRAEELETLVTYFLDYIEFMQTEM